MNRKLAAIILRAAEIREKSWNNVDRYSLTIEQASDMAAKEHGNIAVGRLIYLALFGWWNDTLDWAEQNK